MNLTTTLKKVVKEVGQEISRLEGVRDALSAVNGNKTVHHKRRLSKDARERIAQAQRDRWAKVKRIKKT